MSEQRTWQAWILFLISRGALIYFGLVLLLALLQRHLIYFPAREREEQLLRQGKSSGLYPWRNPEGQLVGWRSSHPDADALPRNRMIVFHGNAGHALHRGYYVDGFHSLAGGTAAWEVFLFEYPGYGSRKGTPGEESILAAARQAMNDLSRDDSRPTYLLGESLGSSFAAHLAADNPQLISGLFLVTPLTCLADVAASHYWFLPVRLMLRERHDVQSYMRAFPGPVAFLVAGRDEVVTDNLGERLFKQYSGRKRLWMQPDAGHNTLDFSPGARWWQEVGDFLTNR